MPGVRGSGATISVGFAARGADERAPDRVRLDRHLHRGDRNRLRLEMHVAEHPPALSATRLGGVSRRSADRPRSSRRSLLRRAASADPSAARPRSSSRAARSRWSAMSSSALSGGAPLASSSARPMLRTEPRSRPAHAGLPETRAVSRQWSASGQYAEAGRLVVRAERVEYLGDVPGGVLVVHAGGVEGHAGRQSREDRRDGRAAGEHAAQRAHLPRDVDLLDGRDERGVLRTDEQHLGRDDARVEPLGLEQVDQRGDIDRGLPRRPADLLRVGATVDDREALDLDYADLVADPPGDAVGLETRDRAAEVPLKCAAVDQVVRVRPRPGPWR